MCVSLMIHTDVKVVFWKRRKSCNHEKKKYNNNKGWGKKWGNNLFWLMPMQWKISILDTDEKRSLLDRE